MSNLQYDPLPFEYSGLNLFVPDPDQVRSAYEKGSVSDFPYWSRIWPSSIALSLYIQENTDLIKNKKICEVGAGLGLPAFTAASYASYVLITDHDPNAIQWINYNIAQLEATHIHSACLNWHESSYPEADIILMSDVGYHEDDFEDVHRMIRNYIFRNSIVLLAVPARIISGKFMSPLEEWIRSQKKIAVSGTDVLCVILSQRV